jgi:hypothetical protein
LLAEGGVTESDVCLQRAESLTVMFACRGGSFSQKIESTNPAKPAKINFFKTPSSEGGVTDSAVCLQRSESLTVMFDCRSDSSALPYHISKHSLLNHTNYI